MEKYDLLIKNLKKYDKICIAFSGGADSALLLKASMDALSGNCFAVIADTDFFSERELTAAVKFAEGIGATYYVTNIELFDIPQIAYNESNRCYHCKKSIFTAISKVAYTYGTKIIADGENADDLGCYRPGNAAKLELGIISPLSECGITKEEVRLISKELGLETWNKPSNSCLTTRFPYETELTKEKLAVIEKGENYLCDMGFSSIRLRAHDNIARIEILNSEMPMMIEKPEVVDFIKGLGFKYVTIDLEGIRSGSMDDV